MKKKVLECICNGVTNVIGPYSDLSVVAK